MQRLDRNVSTDGRRIGAWLGMLGLAVVLSSPARAGSWQGYGENAQHTALAAGPSQVPQAIRWSIAVDLAPQYAGNGNLYTHYGSPAITAHNTVLVPVKTQAQGTFVVTAVNASSGTVMWSFNTDYILPPHNWIPPMGIVLAGGDLWMATPGAGGTVLYREAPDSRKGANRRQCFLGMSHYNQDPAAFNATIFVYTPLTVDSNGNLYFGYYSTGAALPGYPNGVPSGLARLARDGTGSWVSASALSGGQSTKIVQNCAPALSRDGKSVYVATNQYDFSTGNLCQATADANLTPLATVFLTDPNTGGGAWVSDDGTASPTLGPDGDVYYGVLEQNIPSHHDRGWLLHFNSTLSTSKIPGSFGWDDSASILPASLVPSYKGSSTYLVLTKYNDYSDPGIGGTGENKVAILDPNATEPDPITPNVQVMHEVITVVGPTKNTGQPGVREWCINSAAIDEANKCAVINSEDGHVYRWSFPTNSLSTGLQLAPPTGEAYTPTLIGPDGAVYAINNAKLNCCIASTTTSAVAPGGRSTAVAAAPTGPSVPPPATGLALLIGTGLLIAATVAGRRLAAAWA
jgi:hypothetical protein